MITLNLFLKSNMVIHRKENYIYDWSQLAKHYRLAKLSI